MHARAIKNDDSFQEVHHIVGVISYLVFSAWGVNREDAGAHAHSEPGSMHHFRISDSKSLVLPENWSDELIYPDLPYKVEHIIENSTYDKLWQLSGNEFPSQDTGIVSSSTSFESSSLASSMLNSLPSSSRLELSMKTQTKTSTESGSREGFFGHFMGDVGIYIDDIE